MLLLGVHRHGFGNWDAIRDDKSLGLQKKISSSPSDSLPKANDLKKRVEWQFSIVTSMLLALSIILAVVGAVSLMGVVSIGVIERTKEIGVLRAIGARSGTIL